MLPFSAFIVTFTLPLLIMKKVSPPAPCLTIYSPDLYVVSSRTSITDIILCQIKACLRKANYTSKYANKLNFTNGMWETLMKYT